MAFIIPLYTGWTSEAKVQISKFYEHEIVTIIGVSSSFENPQHKFWLRTKKVNFQLHTLIYRPEKCFTIML